MTPDADADADARRIAAGPPPSRLVPAPAADPPVMEPQSGTPAPYDPLRLCVYATIALLGWLAGPITLIVFAGIGFAGYWKAWRGGLKRSKCFVRDTRLVLAYFAALTAAGVWGGYAVITSLLRS
jgi:hypothetical protein